MMTRHRLVRCQPTALLNQVWRRHTGCRQVEPEVLGAEQHGLDLDASAMEEAPWLGRSGIPRSVARWRLLLTGNRWLDCWLEVEQGANGVLAHLSVAPAPGTTGRLPSRRASRIALEAWTAHELAVLARGAESAA